MNNETQTDGMPVKLDTQGIDMVQLLAEYKLSKSYVEQYTRDFQSLDNLVDGISVNQQPGAPFVGDTTLAGLVRQIPRNCLQQLPTFAVVINGSKNSIPALLATYLLKKTAFNEDTFGKGLLSTMQLGAQQALTHGYAPFMSAMGSMYNQFGTTMRLLHFSDTSPEPGITDANESGYHYVTAHITPSRLDKIIKQAQDNKSTTWNVPALKQLRATTPTATDYTQYESNARQNKPGEDSGPTYEIGTRYETDTDATFVTFSPNMGDAPLRVYASASKWGYPRVQYLVIDPAALTPFGVSRVRLASPNQNMMNIYYGQIASMLLLNSKPPLLKRGRFTKPVQLKRGAVWETTDPQASVDLKNMDNGALEQFVPMAQQFAAQIQNIMGVTIGTVNGNGNAFGYSKTAPGVAQQNQVQDLSMNQFTKIMENFLRQYALVALDTLLSEQEGQQNLIVDDETKNAINQLVAGTIGDDNKIGMDWQTFYAAIEEWSVEISESISQDQLEEKKRGDAQDMLTVLAQNAQYLGPQAQAKIQELTDILMQDITPGVKPLAISSGNPIGGVPGAPSVIAGGSQQMPATAPPTGQPVAAPAPAPAA